MKKFAIIVAGGFGTRMANSIPKQYMDLCGKPVLWHTLNNFVNAYSDLEIVLVVADEYRKSATDVTNLLEDSSRIVMVASGHTRYQSVKNGLEQIPFDSIVAVHDGVRCLVTTELIQSCFDKALQNGNAVPAVSVTDSVRIISEIGNSVVDRNHVKIIQTPQIFFSNVIKKAYDQPYEDCFTDDATIVERSGTVIHLVNGEEANIKITRPVDILLAEKILQARGSF